MTIRKASSIAVNFHDNDRMLDPIMARDLWFSQMDLDEIMQSLEEDAVTTDWRA
jgi:hypothetical protein